MKDIIVVCSYCGVLTTKIYICEMCCKKFCLRCVSFYDTVLVEAGVKDKPKVLCTDCC